MQQLIKLLPVTSDDGNIYKGKYVFTYKYIKL